MENYEKLLNKVYENVKIIEGSKERFEIPKIEGFFQGKKTILTNLFQIASYIRRDPEHLLKFLTKELAVKISINGEKVTLNIKVPSKKINPKIERYVEEFVLCKECKKPDTELIKEGKQTIIHCLACGAKHPVRTKI
jgi:translation initiation factor 2 subunit 2